MEIEQFTFEPSVGYWDIREEIKNSLKLIKKMKTAYNNLLDIAKAVLRGKLIVMSAYVKKNREILNK
jgi:hypothetical protein